MDKTCGTCEYYYACDDGEQENMGHTLDMKTTACENWIRAANMMKTADREG